MRNYQIPCPVLLAGDSPAVNRGAQYTWLLLAKLKRLNSICLSALKNSQQQCVKDPNEYVHFSIFPWCKTLKCWNQDPNQTSKGWGVANSPFWGRSQCLQISLDARLPLPLSFPWLQPFHGTQRKVLKWTVLVQPLPAGDSIPDNWSAYQERDAVHYLALLQLLTVNRTNPRSCGVWCALFHICLETSVTTVDRNRSWGADVPTKVSEPHCFIIYG